MDLANYGSSGSESEEDSAELEAHLYSRIYYDNDSQDQTTSLKLYEETSTADSGITSSSSSNADVIRIDDDDDVIKIDDDSGGVPDAEIRVHVAENPSDDVIIIESDESDDDISNPSGKAKEKSAGHNNKFNVDEFISNVFDNKKIQKNPFYVQKDETDGSESDDEESTTGGDVSEVTNSAREETRYSDHTLRANVPAVQQQIRSPTESESSSSEEDEGIKVANDIEIIREVNAALERSLRAECVDIAESEQDQDELEIGNENQIRKMMPKKTTVPTSLSEKQTPSSSKKPVKTGSAVKPSAISRTSARAGKLVVQIDEGGRKTGTVGATPKGGHRGSVAAKRVSHFVAQASSSDDDSSSESDGPPVFASRLSLNLTGVSAQASGVVKSFAEITGVPASARVKNKVKFPGWTPEMQKFYDDVDPEMADVTLDELIDKLPASANWAVSAKDRYSSPGMNNRRQNRYFTSPNFLACSICGQKGHRPNNCTRRYSDKKCYMCGSDDHSKVTCPNMMCLRCGLSGMPYTSTCNRCRYLMDLDCHHCGGRGHLARACPDHWRRYHLTLSPGAIVKPDNTTTNYSKIWCPNCGRRGHLVHQCRAFSSSQHPKSILSVVSYEEHRKRNSADHKQAVEINSQQSDYAKRKRKRLELKEKKKAFRSYPHTPTEPKRLRPSASAPASPFGEGLKDLDLGVFSVTRNLNEAKDRLIRMERDKFNKKSKKNKKGKKTGQNFSRQNHEPTPFPRNGTASRNKFDFSPETPLTRKQKRAANKLAEWRARKNVSSKRKLESENFIKI